MLDRPKPSNTWLQAEAIFKEVDEDGSGEIEFEEPGPYTGLHSV